MTKLLMQKKAQALKSEDFYHTTSDPLVEVVNVVTPTPNTHVGDFELGVLDTSFAFVWIPLLQVFENTHKVEGFMNYDRMRSSLALALGMFPIMSGIPIKSKRVLKGSGAWLCEANTDLDFQAYKPTLGLERMPKQFWFKKQIQAMSEGEGVAPVFSAKINRFRCNSVALSIFVHHWASDGRSLSDFMAVWGKIARGLDLVDIPVDSRHLLPKLAIEPNFSRNMRVDAPNSAVKVDQTLCRFDIPVNAIKEIQKEFSASFFVSIEDIFVAAIWRAKARSLPKDEDTCLYRVVNFRHMLSPPKPKNAFGNFVDICTIGPIKTSQLLDLSLKETSDFLRSELKKFDSNYANSLLAFYQHNQTDFFANVNFTTDLVSSSHTRFHQETDFHHSPPIFTGFEVNMGSLMFIHAIHQNSLFAWVNIHSSDVKSFLEDSELRSIEINASIVPSHRSDL